MPPLLANPELRHQLDSPIAWIFWRDAPNGSGRQGFVAIAFACVRPDCTCTELALHGSLVDERLRFVGRIDDELEYAFAGDHAATELAGATAFASARCTVHLDYTARTVRGGGGDEAVLQQVVPWLQSALDDQLAAEIEHAVQVLKRQPRGIPHDPWRDWRPGDLASHSEHFPAAVLPILDWRDQEWVVEDLHCIDPRCSCDDVRFTFSRIDRGTGTGAATATATFAGTLVTKLPRLEVSDLETEPQLLATTAELRELWRALVARHGDLAALLTQRRREMKQLQPPRPSATVPARRTKVGRNDPCPCGSGKKAKKCCAG